MSTIAQTSAVDSTTPILDRLLPFPESDPRPTRASLIAVAIVVVLPLVCIGLMMWSPGFLRVFEISMRPIQRVLDRAIEAIFSSDFHGFKAVLMPLYPVLAVCVAIVAHEIGHLAFGLCSGLRLNRISFGPIQITPPFRFSLQKNRRPGATALTSMLPVGTHRLRLRMATMIIGGPCASLVTAFAAIYLTYQHLAFAAWYFPVSLLFGITNLVPFQSRTVSSDGKRLWMLMRNREQGERWVAMIRLTNELISGVDPERWPEDFLAKAIAIRDNSSDTVVAPALAYYSKWYKGPDEEAAELLEVCLRYSCFSPPMMQEALKGDAAVFNGRKRKRADLAEQWLAEIPQKTSLPGLRSRVEAAVLEARNDYLGALQKLDEVERALQAQADPTQKAVSLRALNRWKSELQQKITPAAPSVEAVRPN